MVVNSDKFTFRFIQSNHRKSLQTPSVIGFFGFFVYILFITFS